MRLIENAPSAPGIDTSKPQGARRRLGLPRAPSAPGIPQDAPGRALVFSGAGFPSEGHKAACMGNVAGEGIDGYGLSATFLRLAPVPKRIEWLGLS